MGTITWTGSKVQSYTESGETYAYAKTQTTKTDSRGNTWTFPHTELGLVTDEIPPGGAPSKKIGYNGDGSIAWVKDESGVNTEYTYTSNGSVASITRAAQTECAEVKDKCIEKCSDETLPTGDPGGWPFYKCLNTCMQENGC